MSPVASTRLVRSRKEDRQKALVQAAFNQIAEGGLEGLRTRGVRKLLRDEPEVGAGMGELALRSARDPSLAGIMGEAFKAWHKTLRGLLQRATRNGYLARDLDYDDAAALIMATLTSMTLPSTASADRTDRAFRQLERWLGLSSTTRRRSVSSK